MKKCLSVVSPTLYYYEDEKRIDGQNPNMRGDCSYLSGACSGLSGDCSNLRGDCSDLSGDCSGLSGDCSNLRGACSDLSGNLYDCKISEKERRNGVEIRSLVM